MFNSSGIGSGGSSDGGATTDVDATTIGATTSVDSDGGVSGTGTGTGSTSSTSVDGSSTSSAVETTGCVAADWFEDADGDSFGAGAPVSACEPPDGYADNGDDCDDDAAGVNPDADELCDGVDNDCDDIVDEYAATNAECGGCAMKPFNGRLYSFCDADTPWDKARVICEARGGTLVVVNDEDEHAFIVSEVTVRVGEWWLGATDREVEGQFFWIDGVPLPDEDPRWAWSQPDNGIELNDEDCVVIGGLNSPVKGRWHDTDCELGTIVGATRPMCESDWTP
ncbi:MAG: hypothetical protein H6713_01710 [Myxococcales bacterium]|nr:hypothetical protein [Myxococcales bacterium]